jgi:hypothetical protein
LNTVGPHCSLTSAVTAAISGRPVACPALSTHVFMGVTSGLNRALVPTIANAFWHESI